MKWAIRADSSPVWAAEGRGDAIGVAGVAPAAGLAAELAGEIAEGLVDGRQALGEPIGQQQALRDDPKVGEEGPEAGLAGKCDPRCRRGAGQTFVTFSITCIRYVPPSKREDAVRLVAGGRELVLVGAGSG